MSVKQIRGYNVNTMITKKIRRNVSKCYLLDSCSANDEPHRDGDLDYNGLLKLQKLDWVLDFLCWIRRVESKKGTNIVTFHSRLTVSRFSSLTHRENKILLGSDGGPIVELCVFPLIRVMV